MILQIFQVHHICRFLSLKTVIFIFFPAGMNASRDETSQKEESPQNSSSPQGRKTKSIKDLYEVTEEINAENPVFFAFFAGEDPISYEEASKSEKWNQAMNEEIKAIAKNGTWELTILPPNKSSIGVK